MFFGDPVKATQANIDRCRAALELFPAVAAVIDQFDGKVYNKRFDKAVKESVPGVWCNISYGSIRIYTGPYSDDITICSMRKNELKDGKRIDAAAWKKELKNRMLSCYTKMRSMEDALPRVYEIKKEVETLRNEANKLVGSIPYCMQDYFDIKHQY